MKPKGSFDWTILAAALSLLSFGLLVLSSITPDLFKYQLIYSLVGLIIFIIVSHLDWRIYPRFGWYLYASALVILIFTLFLGSTSRGAVRWVNIAGYVLQPTEIAKPLLIIFFANLLSKIDKYSLPSFLASFMLFLLPFGLIFFQPDLGSAIILACIWLGIMLASGVPVRFLSMLGVLSAAAFPLIWHLLHDYQRQRLAAFIDPFADPLNSGYNIIQSITAVGSGRLSGWGLGRGPQSHLRFLPENHTDFIFATLAEELGFVGTFTLLILFAFLVWRVLVIAKNTQGNFEFMLVIGIFSLIFGQMFINIGMNVGLLPVTGITLPLVSYGGSSLLSTFICLGLLESVARFKSGNELKYQS